MTYIGEILDVRFRPHGSLDLQSLVLIPQLIPRVTVSRVCLRVVVKENIVDRVLVWPLTNRIESEMLNISEGSVTLDYPSI